MLVTTITRKRGALVLLGLAALSGLATSAAAQDDEEAPVRTKKYKAPDAEWIEKAMAFLNERYDADQDGKVSFEEYTRAEVYWRRLDRNGNGFIEPTDWETAPPDKPVRWVYRAPGEGSLMPNFSIQLLEAEADPNQPPESLATQDRVPKMFGPAALRSEGPVAILFGNNTAPKFRKQLPEFQRLAAEYGDSISFAIVYGPELHPIDGPSPSDGMDVPLVEEPATMPERFELARRLQNEFGIDNIKILVDNLGYLATMMYRGRPGRIYWVYNALMVGWRSDTGSATLEIDVLEDKIRDHLHLPKLQRPK